MAKTPSQDIPDIADIHLAHARISKQVRTTPVINEARLDALLGCRLYCKCENLQRTGAFKFRGASNAVLSLEEDGALQDVATHSSGNHGAALALAASLAGVTADVVMPKNSSRLKIAAVRSFGGRVHFCEPTHEARDAGLENLVQAGRIAVHPYDNPAIIAGQGTAAIEFTQQVPELEQLITPLGGGGLVSGTAIAAEPGGIEVFAVEPEGAADTARSLEQGSIIGDHRPDTIADGLRALVGVRNFAIVRERVRKVVTVTDDEIREAMVLALEYLKLLIEPSSATVIAAVRKYPELFGGKCIGAVISGGNIHPEDWVGLTGDRVPA